MLNVLTRGLARSRTIRHPSGSTVRTPLLVPAFSTKGFRFKGSRSEIREYMKWAQPLLEDSFLVSAYDLYYGHLPSPKNLPRARLMFLDSGGYETSVSHDLSAVFQHNCECKAWDEGRMREVVAGWPESLPAAIVSFDHGQHRVSLSRQIRAAHRLFSSIPGHLHELILKPEKSWNGYLECEAVCAHVKKFGDFHILGVTEKELGKSTKDRVINLANIRRALDMANIDVPLHVFGSLDPVTSTLYFLAGGEIFDGLTWLRYGYLGGAALYYQNYALLEPSLSMSWEDEKSIGYMVLSNLNYLSRLRDDMMAYLSNGNFRRFEPALRKCAERTYEILCTEMGGQS